MNKAELIKTLRRLADTLEKDDVRLHDVTSDLWGDVEEFESSSGTHLIRTGTGHVRLHFSYERLNVKAKDIERALAE